MIAQSRTSSTDRSKGAVPPFERRWRLYQRAPNGLIKAAHRLLQPPNDGRAAENTLAVVENDGLAGRDGALRFPEADLGTAVRKHADGRRDGLAAVADARLHGDFARRRLAADERAVFGDEAASHQHFVGADDDAVGVRLDVHDEERLGAAAGGYPPPLADSVLGDAG